MNKLLTIIIPTYNMQDYLHRCLDSLIVSDEQMAQLEVLVINDGSKDNSSAIAHEYEARYPATFRVIDKENGNYGSCINRGLKEASGKYIKVLDADDWFDTEVFERYLHFLAKTDVDLIVSDFDLITATGEIKQKYRYEIAEGIHDLNCCESIKNMMMHAVTYRTAIFSGLNYHQTEGISYTDQEWIFLPMIRVKSLCGFPYVLYQYNVGREGQTVDPKVFARNIGQEIQSWKAQQTTWDSLTDNDLGNARDYMWYRLTCRARYIYSNTILNYRQGFKNEPLIELDGYIHEHNQPLYAELDSVTAREGCKFRYIHCWRKHHHLRPVIWLAYKVESVLRRRLLNE